MIADVLLALAVMAFVVLAWRGVTSHEKARIVIQQARHDVAANAPEKTQQEGHSG